MATKEFIEAHFAAAFKPDTEQEPLVRVAEALEFIAGKMHDMSFDLSEVVEAVDRVANNG